MLRKPRFAKKSLPNRLQIVRPRRSQSAWFIFAAIVIAVVCVATLVAFRVYYIPRPAADASNATASTGLLDLPDPALTPGAVDASVTEENIGQTICVTGYTKTVRPSQGYTGNLKREQLNDPRRGYTDQSTRDFEEDHLIPLEIGGSPDDPRNLWPEPWAGSYGAHTKDLLENELHRRVCLPIGDPERLDLAVAQRAIATNWKEAYREYVGN